MRVQLTQTKLIFFVALFFVLFDNITFFENVLKVYPWQLQNSGFLLSLSVVLVAFITLLFTLLSSKYTTKPLLILTLLISSMTNYFMNSYHAIIDEDMIRNLMQTNMDESLDLLTIKQVGYFIFLGVLPSVLVYKSNIIYRPLKQEIWAKIKTILLSLFIIAGLIFLFSKHYTSFLREHKPLRFTTNPTYWIYSIGKYINKTDSAPKVLKVIGKDAKITTKEHNKLVIMVVGEAARADHFSLNGYQRETNPKLKKEAIINLSNLYSCGTSTAQSVPCMFSIFDKDNYSYKKGISTENVIDVLKHTGDIALLWRDNNSDSKGVALRIPYQSYKDPKINTICDTECRDEGMLVGLDRFIEKNKNRDVLIVLHQMGNHGPAYFKRYPKEFEKFKPVCKTNQLEECSQQEIQNAYDNAILYTDTFLAKTIEFLKSYKDKKTSLLYMADHGESLGENGIYLHGLPYFMAPDAQTHVAALMWFGDNFKKELDIQKLQKASIAHYSHDNLFHTLLGLFKIQTEVYNPQQDILKQ